MSLYCFGKFVPGLNVSELLSGCRCRVLIPDPEDIQELSNFSELANQGEVFSICDCLGSNDATALWQDAMQNPANSDLLDIINRLLTFPDTHTGSIAFVDGGIERVVRASAKECLQEIKEILNKPWDTIGNPLYIWEQDFENSQDLN
jgi:hypothetical protein